MADENDGKKHHNWVFTLCNWNDDELQEIERWKYVRYILVGKEHCPKTGTPHLQGYVEWTSARLFSTLKKFNPRISWRIAKGDAISNYRYISKENLYLCKGEPAHQGERNDLNAIKDMIDAGATMLEVAEEHFSTWTRSHKAFDKYMFMKSQHRSEPPTCIWLWGSAGVGKTKCAWDMPGSKYIKDGTSWWDGYEFQDVIVIDDFDGKWPYRDFLRLLDRYPYQGQVKGGYIRINSRTIVLTCEHPPEYFWTGNELRQVTRRFTEIRNVTSSTEVSGNTRSDTFFTESAEDAAEREKKFLEKLF